MSKETRLTPTFMIRPSFIEGADKYELLSVADSSKGVRSRVVNRAGALADVRALGLALVAFADAQSRESSHDGASCICSTGHAHRGGVGGCYFGGTLVTACPCRWNGEP